MDKPYDVVVVGGGIASKQPWSAATAIAPLLGPEATAAEGYEPEAIERLLAMQF